MMSKWMAFWRGGRARASLKRACDWTGVSNAFKVREGLALRKRNPLQWLISIDGFHGGVGWIFESLRHKRR